MATAGHVDHGKSTLVRALTGMEPDRWAEERRRGLTIDLGFAWTELASGATAAFVDVPGHERFVSTMLAGVGPVPAVLLVVAADEGWMPQSAEHLDALAAFGVGHGLLIITRSDLLEPELAMAEATEQLAGTPLAGIDAVAVSATTGAGMDALRTALDTLLAGLPAPDPHADVRLWVDRAFTIRGAGTVVTGTLGAGRIRVDDELELVTAAGARRVTVRGLQTLGEPAAAVRGTARVAVNLRGLARDAITRGDVLLSPGRWLTTDQVDVALRGVRGGPVAADRLPGELVLHLGAAAVPVRVRPLGADTARLRLSRPLPLRIGDRAVLRDPGRRAVAGGLTVLDVQPPPLRRRGAAAGRAEVLAELAGALAAAVAAHDTVDPLDPGLPVEAARRAVGLPEPRLVDAVLRHASGHGLVLRAGRVLRVAAAPGAAAVRPALAALREQLDRDPFAAPEADRLAELGLGPRQLAALVRAGELLKVADGVVLLPGADERAVAVLAGLGPEFTLSQARQALRTTRRVAVPLLELLARTGRTTRTEEGGHRLVDTGPPLGDDDDVLSGRAPGQALP